MSPSVIFFLIRQVETMLLPLSGTDVHMLQLGVGRYEMEWSEVT